MSDESPPYVHADRCCACGHPLKVVWPDRQCSDKAECRERLIAVALQAEVRINNLARQVKTPRTARS